MKLLRNKLSNYGLMGLIGISLLLGIGCLIYLGRDIHRPFGGLIIIYTQVDPSTPIWWPGMVDDSATYRYRIKELRGEAVDKERIPAIFQEAYDQGETTVSVIFEDDDRLISRRLPVLLFGWNYFFDFVGARIITGMGFWLLAVIVYGTRPNETANRLAAIAFCLLAVNQWLVHPTLYWNKDEGREFFLFIFWNVVNTFLGVILAHFALTFPKPAQPRWRWLILLPWYSLVMLIFGVEIIDYVIGIDEPMLLSELKKNKFSGFFLSFLGLTVMVGRYIQLAVTDRHNPRIWYQIRILSGGLFGASPGLIILFVDGLTSGDHYQFSILGFDTRYLFFIAPLAIAYTMLRYQSLYGATTAVVIVLFLSSSALVASFGAGVLRVLEPRLIELTNFSPFFALFMMGLVMGIFWSYHSSSRGWFKKLFHRQALNYEATHNFGQRLLGQTNIETLPQQIADSLVAELGLEQAVVWQSPPNDPSFWLTGESGSWDRNPPHCVTVLYDETLPNVISLTGEKSTMPTWLSHLPAELALLVPLTTPEGTIGILGLGKRWDEEIFDQRDLEIIGLIAQQTALFLLTAKQIDALRQVPHHISEAQERERDKLAKELHDTTQQFLGRLPFFLEASRHALTANPTKSDEIIQRCVGDVEEAARTLRQIRNNLSPGQLNQGVIQSLQDLAQAVRVRHDDVLLTLSLSPQLDRQTTLIMRHALYRVVQQALDNAISHAQASHITIQIDCSTSRINFTVTDDGCGFSTAQRRQAQAEGHVGLQSMEDRIQSLGGQCRIISSPHQGTQIQGWLPTPTNQKGDIS